MLGLLIPYIKKDKVWPYQQIAEIHWADTEEILMEGSKAFKDISYSDLAKKVSAVNHDKFSPSDLVDPFLDSANSRWFFFNSTSRPFGMVNLSPDNGVQSDWGAGYRYKSDSINALAIFTAGNYRGFLCYRPRVNLKANWVQANMDPPFRIQRK